MSRDFDRWLKTMKFEMNSLYINQVWTMVEATMGMTQQIANRNVNLDFLLAIAAHHLESLSLVGGQIYLQIKVGIKELVLLFLMR